MKSVTVAEKQMEAKFMFNPLELVVIKITKKYSANLNRII